MFANTFGDSRSQVARDVALTTKDSGPNKVPTYTTPNDSKSDYTPPVPMSRGRVVSVSGSGGTPPTTRSVYPEGRDDEDVSREGDVFPWVFCPRSPSRRVLPREA